MAVFKVIRKDKHGRKDVSLYTNLSWADKGASGQHDVSIYRETTSGTRQLIKRVKNGVTVKRVWAQDWR